MSDAARLASEGYLPKDFLMAANDQLFRIYQGWELKNPGTYLDEIIEEDGKWQQRQKIYNFYCTQLYDIPSGRVGKWFVATLAVELNGIRN